MAAKDSSAQSQIISPPLCFSCLLLRLVLGGIEVLIRQNLAVGTSVDKVETIEESIIPKDLRQVVFGRWWGGMGDNPLSRTHVAREARYDLRGLFSAYVVRRTRVCGSSGRHDHDNRGSRS